MFKNTTKSFTLITFMYFNLCSVEPEVIYISSEEEDTPRYKIQDPVETPKSSRALFYGVFLKCRFLHSIPCRARQYAFIITDQKG